MWWAYENDSEGLLNCFRMPMKSLSQAYMMEIAGVLMLIDAYLIA